MVWWFLLFPFQRVAGGFLVDRCDNGSLPDPQGRSCRRERIAGDGDRRRWGRRIIGSTEVGSPESGVAGCGLLTRDGSLMRILAWDGGQERDVS